MSLLLLVSDIFNIQFSKGLIKFSYCSDCSFSAVTDCSLCSFSAITVVTVVSLQLLL